MNELWGLTAERLFVESDFNPDGSLKDGIHSQEGVGAVMVGTRNSRHVASNLRTLQFDLSGEQMSRIRTFLSAYPILPGDCFGLERTSPRYLGILLMDLNGEPV